VDSFTEETDEVLEGSAEAIDRPRCDEVEFSRRNTLAYPVECGALVTPFGPLMP
jgi:hypothetical protein